MTRTASRPKPAVYVSKPSRGSVRLVDLPDGLYRVETRAVCAGFEVKDGQLSACAPILRRHLARWAPKAHRICLDSVGLSRQELPASALQGETAVSEHLTANDTSRRAIGSA